MPTMINGMNLLNKIVFHVIHYMKIVTLGQDLSDRTGYFALRKITFFVFADKIWRKEER